MVTFNDTQSDAGKAEIIDITCYGFCPLGWDHLVCYGLGVDWPPQAHLFKA